MPAKPQWFLRLPQILDALSVLEFPVLDRAAIECVFGVKRRRAIELLNAFGGYQAGRTFLIDRAGLIQQLERIRAGEDFAWERRRRKRLAEALEVLCKHRAAARVTLHLEPEALNRKVADLPEGIRLEPHRLTVQFSGVEDLLSKLYQLGRAAANDFEGFQALAGENQGTEDHRPLRF